MPARGRGNGEVYRARDTRLDRTVALKVLPPRLGQDPALRARFQREARAVSALQHPHICTLHDIGEQEGQAFLVMEHLGGETLAERLKKGSLPLPQALEAGIQIADALAAAHRQDIVHRDLKPGNVMLTSTEVKPLVAAALLGGIVGRRLLTPASPRSVVVRSLLDVSPAEEVNAGGRSTVWLPTASRWAVARPPSSSRTSPRFPSACRGERTGGHAWRREALPSPCSRTSARR